MRGTAAAVVRVFGNGRLRAAEIAFAAFSLSEYGVWTAILVYAYGHGGTTTAGLIAVLQLVPAALVAPFAAALADRRGGGFALVLGYWLQAAAMGATAAVMLAGGPAAVAYAFAVLAATAVTLSRPAQAKHLSALADTPDELTAATAVSGWLEGASALAGPALAGLGLALDGPGLVFAVFAVAVALGGTIVAPSASAPEADTDEDRDEDDGGALAGVSALRQAPAWRALVLVIAAEHVAVGALDVLVVVLAISALGLGQPGAGYLNAAFGAGAALGGFAGVMLSGARTVALPLVGAAVAWAILFAAIGAWQTAAVAFILLPMAGVCQAVLDTGGRALLARITPHRVLARVFGVLEGLAMAGLALGSLLVPILVSLGGITAALVGVGVILILAALAPLRSLRGLDTAVPPTAAIQLLRGYHLFAPLPVPVLEGLARELTTVPVQAGSTIITEGEPGDRFYLIVEGEFDVAIAGEHIRTMTAGGGFGEIALLRNVPRTATVVARTDGLLYGLEGQAFLDALRPAI